jgi:aldose sugar dehydrogenase
VDPGSAGSGGDARVSTPGGTAVQVVTVVDGLEHPWSMAFLPDGDLLITERPGRLRRVRNGTLLPDPIAGIPEVHARGQGGLLDVQLHPAFADNGWVYLTYSKSVPGGATTALFRGRLEGDRLVEGADLFVADAVSQRGEHFGSRLAFDGEGHLFMTVGDRADRPSAQDRSDHQGTVLRLRDDGSVPPDNPFVGEPGVRPEIWSWGHRNPQGLTFHPTTGELWSTEHGPQGGDELNRILPGRNYGWPEVTFGREYGPARARISRESEREGMESPVTEWTPSIGASGLAFYTGDRIPSWTGSLFAGGLAQANLVRITLEGNQVRGEEKLLEDYGRRIRDVRDGPDGFLYLLVDAPEAPLVRLEPVP